MSVSVLISHAHSKGLSGTGDVAISVVIIVEW